MDNWRKLIIGFFFTVSVIIKAEPQELDKITAIVNDSVVLKSDVDDFLKITKTTAKNIGKKIPDDNALRFQILERLIMDKIILQLAKKLEIQIADQEIDLTISHIAAKNGLTVGQFYKKLLMDGISLESYRNDVRKEMMIEEVRNNEVYRRITILPQEVDSLAAQLHLQSTQDINFNLSQILITLPENSTNEQNQLAMDTVNKIFIQLKKGVKFDNLAIIYSADPDALKGGIIGWSKLEQLPTGFAKRIQFSKKGDIIGPIRSNIGFHIFKINDVQVGNIPLLVTEVKARHILIKISPIMNKEQAHEKIQKIAQKIKAGQLTFSEAAKEYSQDPGSALRGGELGWNIPDIYDPVFRDTLMCLSKNETSQPILSRFGWHLIQLEDSRQVDKTDVSQKDRAYRLLFNRKFNEEAQIWMQEQRASAYVNILNDRNQ